MNKLALLGIMVLSISASAFAQDDKKPEFFGGYSFESINSGINSTDVGTTTSLDNRFKANGFQSGTATLDDDDLIRALFDPITNDLKLTADQKFQIAAIARDTMTRSEIFFDQIDELEDQLSIAAFTGQMNENKIRQLSEKQGALFGEIMAMKARAKAGFNEVLTGAQRAIIVDQYKMRPGENNLGAISNNDQ